MGKTADTEHREGDCMTVNTEHTWENVIHLSESEFFKVLECLDELEQLKRRQYREIQDFNNSLRSYYKTLDEAAHQG